MNDTFYLKEMPIYHDGKLVSTGNVFNIFSPSGKKVNKCPQIKQDAQVLLALLNNMLIISKSENKGEYPDIIASMMFADLENLLNETLFD